MRLVKDDCNLPDDLCTLLDDIDPLLKWREPIDLDDTLVLSRLTPGPGRELDDSDELCQHTQGCNYVLATSAASRHMGIDRTNSMVSIMQRRVRLLLLSHYSEHKLTLESFFASELSDFFSDFEDVTIVGFNKDLPAP